jgi:hypothetical protein
MPKQNYRKMTRDELAGEIRKIIAQRYDGALVSKPIIRAVIDALAPAAVHGLKRGKVVELPKLVRIFARRCPARAERLIKSPLTGEMAVMAARPEQTVIAFRSAYGCRYI